MCLADDDECVGEKFGLCPNRRAEDVFQPGDRILFQRNGVWSGQTFEPQGNGNLISGRWITVGAYGKGEKPVLAGHGRLASLIRFDSKSFTGGWVISNLTLTGAKMGLVAIRSPSAPADGLVVEYCAFSDMTGNALGAGKNPGYPVSVFTSYDLYLHGIDHVTIQNSQFAYSDMAFDIRWANHVLVKDITVSHTYHEGVWFSASNDVVMTDSQVYDVGTKGMSWGTAGVEFNGGTNILLSHTVIAYVQAPNLVDGVRVDFEENDVNATVNHVNIHGCMGPAFLIMENPGWGTPGMKKYQRVSH